MSQSIREQMIKRDFPRDDAIMEMGKQIAIFHLWLEEYLYGDTSVDLDEVWPYLHRAISLSHALLEGDELDEHGFAIQPFRSPAVRTKLKKLRYELTRLQTLAGQRIQNKNKMGIGTEADQEFDRIHKEILVVAHFLEQHIKKDLTLNQAQSQLLIKVILGLVIAIITMTVIGLLLRERKIMSADAELRKSEEKYRTLFESANDGIFTMKITDKGFPFADCNASTVDMLGCSREDIINKSPLDFSPPVQPDGKTSEEKVLEHNSAVMNGNPQSFEWTCLKADGTPFESEINLTLVEIGSELYIQATVRDITERKKLESQLLHSQKMESIGTLAGGIAHDFNNILTGIIGLALVIKRRMNKDDPLRLYVEQIDTAAQSGAHLTGSLLTFSRKQKASLIPMNINDAIINSSGILERVIGEHIAFDITLADTDSKVMADSNQIEQVLMNLATNARDAMPEGGSLTISTGFFVINDEFVKTNGYGKEGAYTLISVSDTGMGMDKQTRDKIFEPFYTTKEVHKGTGLGLSIVYGIVKQHNGFITVESEPHKGTTFNVYLPVTAQEVTCSDSSLSELSALLAGTEKVLVAEDDALIRGVITSVLGEFGYRTIAAEDGDDAVQKFAENRDDIQFIISDVVMPKKNGKDMYEEIKNIRPDMKCLFLSAYAEGLTFQGDIPEKDVHFMSKPVKPEHLVSKMREMIDGVV
jgi:PAS domain S-box-containing protein